MIALFYALVSDVRNQQRHAGNKSEGFINTRQAKKGGPQVVMEQGSVDFHGGAAKFALRFTVHGAALPCLHNERVE